MNKYEYKQRMAKIRWATEKLTGKKMGKKGLIEAQKIVMEMLKDTLPKPLKSSWKENLTENNCTKLSIDLSQIIGKDFKKNGTFSPR